MNPSVMTYLDTYCERAGQVGALAEPLNLFTNLCFIVAALLCARTVAASGIARKTDLWLLVGALFSIGVGSGLWHLVPARATMLMDVIPITLFINIYLISALRRLFHLSWWKVLFFWAVYFVAGIVAQKTLPPDLLNGTIMYIPTYLALVVMTLALLVRDRASGKAFLEVVIVWSCSLVFRTEDREICDIGVVTFGTHFLWHIFNAWVLWRLTQVLIVRARHA